VLLGSQRQLDRAQSWYGQGSVLLQPAHPFTQASQQPVTPGRAIRYDISLLANFTLIPAGDRIQVVAQPASPRRTSTRPLTPTPQELAGLADGTYTIGKRRGHPPPCSTCRLPTPGQFHVSPVNWGPSILSWPGNQGRRARLRAGGAPHSAPPALRFPPGGPGRRGQSRGPTACCCR